VERAKVVVERVVQEGVVDSKVARRVSVRDQRSRSSSVSISRGSLSGRFGAGQRSIGSRRVHVGAQVKSVCESSELLAPKASDLEKKEKIKPSAIEKQVPVPNAKKSLGERGRHTWNVLDNMAQVLGVSRRGSHSFRLAFRYSQQRIILRHRSNTRMQMLMMM
jgi:hypothetical protein